MVLTAFAIFSSHEQAAFPPFSAIPSAENDTAGSCFAENICKSSRIKHKPHKKKSFLLLKLEQYYYNLKFNLNSNINNNNSQKLCIFANQTNMTV